MLQRVVVCCRVLQCVPVCCSILGGVRGSGASVAAQSHVAAHLSRASCMLQRVAVCYRVRVLQHVAVCWEASEGVEQVLLHICLLSCVSCVPAAGVAACCSGLPSVAVCREAPEQVMLFAHRVCLQQMLQRVAVYCSVLQFVVLCCSVLQCVALC